MEPGIKDQKSPAVHEEAAADTNEDAEQKKSPASGKGSTKVAISV
jgi:hypothetical protein